jgi:hypothetical protein
MRCRAFQSTAVAERTGRPPTGCQLEETASCLHHSRRQETLAEKNSLPSSIFSNDREHAECNMEECALPLQSTRAIHNGIRAGARQTCRRVWPPPLTKTELQAAAEWRGDTRYPGVRTRYDARITRASVIISGRHSCLSFIHSFIYSLSTR